MSGARIEDEGLFLVQHEYWQEAMRRALAAEKNFTTFGANSLESFLHRFHRGAVDERAHESGFVERIADANLRIGRL